MNVVWCLRSTGQGFFDEISNFEITQQITAGSKLQVSESTIRMLKLHIQHAACCLMSIAQQKFFAQFKLTAAVCLVPF